MVDLICGVFRLETSKYIFGCCDVLTANLMNDCWLRLESKVIRVSCMWGSVCHVFAPIFSDVALETDCAYFMGWPHLTTVPIILPPLLLQALVVYYYTLATSQEWLSSVHLSLDVTMNCKNVSPAWLWQLILWYLISHCKWIWRQCDYTSMQELQLESMWFSCHLKGNISSGADSLGLSHDSPLLKHNQASWL
jgi:hypothetical protein